MVLPIIIVVFFDEKFLYQEQQLQLITYAASCLGIPPVSQTLPRDLHDLEICEALPMT